MGRSFSLFLLRASAIVCAGLLLFALARGAHAGPYDGDNYGLDPLPPPSPQAAATATAFNGDVPGVYTPAPGNASGAAANGGFTPAPVRSAEGPPAPLTSPAPESGFVPAPAGNRAAPSYRTAAGYGGYQPAPAYQAPYQPAPVYREPLPPPADQPMTDTPPNSTYGLEPSLDMSTPPARAPRPAQAASPMPPPPALQGSYPQRAPGQNAFQRNPVPAPPTDYRQPGDATTPYGYNKGDGEPSRVGAAGPPVFQQPYQRAAYYPGGTTASGDDPSYILGSGDKIHVAVFDEPDLTGDHAVDGSGFVQLPLIGEVRAAGYTTGQLEAVIGSKLANGYLRAPRVSVQVVTYRPFYVIGAVGRPGEYPYVNHMTVLNAVAMAGGFLPSAIESSVYIRPQGGTHEYQVPVDAGTPIHPGDVVRVNTTFFWDAMNLFSPLNGVAAIAVAGIR